MWSVLARISRFHSKHLPGQLGIQGAGGERVEKMTERQTGREGERQRDRETERQREAGKQTRRERQRTASPEPEPAWRRERE